MLTGLRSLPARTSTTQSWRPVEANWGFTPHLCGRDGDTDDGGVPVAGRERLFSWLDSDGPNGGIRPQKTRQRALSQWVR